MAEETKSGAKSIVRYNISDFIPIKGILKYTSRVDSDFSIGADIRSVGLGAYNLFLCGAFISLTEGLESLLR